MKKLIFVFCFIGVLFSCSDDDDNQIKYKNLIGTWILSEIKEYPSDGKEIFIKVESDMYLVFKKNNIIESNYSLCGYLTIYGTIDSGKYELDEGSTTSGEIYAGCNNRIPYFVLEGSTLFIYNMTDNISVEKYIRK